MPDTFDNSGSASPLAGAEVGNLQLQVEGLTASQNQFNQSLLASERIGRQFGRSLTNAFVGLAIQGKSFGDVLRSLALSLSNIALRAAFKPLENAFGSALQSLIGGAPTPFSAGAIAAPSGFPISAGASIGAATLSSTPIQSTFASPLSSALSVAPSVVLNVTTPDAESFRRSETQLAALLARAVGQGQRNL